MRYSKCLILVRDSNFLELPLSEVKHVSLRFMTILNEDYCINLKIQIMTEQIFKLRETPPGTRRHFDINDWSKLGPDVILIA